MKLFAKVSYNGKEALRQLEDFHLTVIILDLMMPKMDGFEFPEQVPLNPALRAIPVVISTAKTLEPDELSRLGKTCSARFQQRTGTIRLN